MLYFTADEHIYHKNILKYCNRPFSSIEEMEQVFIENHNNIVNDKDDVFHLGDVTMMKNPEPYIKQLKGNHYLIRGNHDKTNISPDVFGWIENTALLRYNKQKIFLSHYCHRVWPSSHHGCIHLFGHSHGELKVRGRCMDVGIDSIPGYRPISIEEILSIMNNKSVEGDSRHHIYQRLVE